MCHEHFLPSVSAGRIKQLTVGRCYLCTCALDKGWCAVVEVGGDGHEECRLRCTVHFNALCSGGDCSVCSNNAHLGAVADDLQLAAIRTRAFLVGYG